MVIEKNEKVHVIYRALYENSTRRHVIGEVVAVEGSICRIKGYVYIYNEKGTEFVRKDDKRITIIDLAESGYIVNVIDSGVDLDAVTYSYVSGVGTIVTDGKNFRLSVNEFTSRY